MSEKVPHQAVVLVKAEIMQRLPDGKVSGRPIKTISKLYTFTGMSPEECELKVNEFLERLNNEKCKTEG